MRISTGTYLGNLRTELTHLHSGQTITTDAPKDNNGLGQAFSPTDLAASSLGTCMATVMGIEARRHNQDLDGMTWEVEKIMASGPRRIAAITINVYWPNPTQDHALLARLKEIGLNCPVALSLHPDIKQEIVFHF